MQGMNSITHVATTLCGFNIFNIEDEANLDELSAEGHTTDYVRDPVGWWKAHGLTYIPELHGPIVVDEWVGVTLEECAGEIEDESGVYREWTFNDVQELVRVRVEMALQEPVDYDDVGWTTVMSVFPDFMSSFGMGGLELGDDEEEDE